MRTYNRLQHALLLGALGLLLSACQTAPLPVRPAAADLEAEIVTASRGLAEPAAQAAAAAVAAEAAAAVPPPDPAAEREKALAKALETYADGRYEDALAELNALPNVAVLSLAAQVGIHKTKAFSHCVLQQLRQCRQSFEAALALDPSFQLTEAERGHPVWGREFRAARSVAARKRPPAR